MDLKWNIVLDKIEMTGGEVAQSRIVETYISECLFSHVNMEDLEIRGDYDENRMESVAFRNVVLRGGMDEEPLNGKENVFEGCDMEGFTFIKESLGFDFVRN